MHVHTHTHTHTHTQAMDFTGNIKSNLHLKILNFLEVKDAGTCSSYLVSLRTFMWLVLVIGVVMVELAVQVFKSSQFFV